MGIRGSGVQSWIAGFKLGFLGIWAGINGFGVQRCWFGFGVSRVLALKGCLGVLGYGAGIWAAEFCCVGIGVHWGSIYRHMPSTKPQNPKL
jgi:hypothetical protein